ncbi:RagB/SusD family nutrient uptake outer membrane protein [Sphingobacterium faecale]|uniref:RagB/SusD family nutrient uptake outer membrane protein n=1 Tax=Sphingobacterium faecale TaxID=2803775 RepID=A0ABS1R8E9_9SPHI|nr:RagB/SusD family nutrient uptake outer membrane protein [Sphingobacterium faecale]MBL1410834.1 RagB/SusD family nutrient uptake outer membrane protein [Sphingobacterium faecale]
MNRLLKNTILTIFMAGSLSSCNKFIDVIPDNVADVEMAFNLRATAERYLFTCYSFLPKHGDVWFNPQFLAGNEVAYSYSWLDMDDPRTPFSIALGLQNPSTPLADTWNDRLFVGIRECNVFLEHIHRVPDMTEIDRQRWISEVKFLKAYYHFYLLRMYGPIPLIDKNLPLGATEEQVRIHRRPIDECFNYITTLIDEATQGLPDVIEQHITEDGRLTQAIAKAMKAYILVTAASPLFNGNNDYVNFRNNLGEQLFNPTYSKQKWDMAKQAARDAIDFAEQHGIKLYRFRAEEIPNRTLKPSTHLEMNIRNATTKAWNEELIWGDPNSIPTASTYAYFVPRLSPEMTNNSTNGSYAPTINLALDFYSRRGVPIEEDTQWEYDKRFQTKVASANEIDYMQVGYETAVLNFDREPRFYANLGFDGGKWYGHDKMDDNNPNVVRAKKGEASASTNVNRYNLTGYFAKKLINYQAVMEQSFFQPNPYPWPVIRLADLYLLYAEASNEAEGPSADIYSYLDAIRERAGLEGVIVSWQKYARNPNKPSSKEGLREIIRRERKIELALEGHRFWDQRRWKTATQELNAPIYAWDVQQSLTASYYRPTVIVQRRFLTKDYLWPIKQSNLIQNPNLLQNPGW